MKGLILHVANYLCDGLLADFGDHGELSVGLRQLAIQRLGDLERNDFAFRRQGIAGQVGAAQGSRVVQVGQRGRALDGLVIAKRLEPHNGCTGGP